MIKQCFFLFKFFTVIIDQESMFLSRKISLNPNICQIVDFGSVISDNSEYCMITVRGLCKAETARELWKPMNRRLIGREWVVLFFPMWIFECHFNFFCVSFRFVWEATQGFGLIYHPDDVTTFRYSAMKTHRLRVWPVFRQLGGTLSFSWKIRETKTLNSIREIMKNPAE